jgi:methylmalonyl-CoA mutase cobalamin-binding subunit
MLIATTPTGQLHEIGAALVAAAATHQGWRVTYLGASLPADEIASAAIQNQARAVALSIVHPADDPALAGELHRLRRLLPPQTALLAGGGAARAYAGDLQASGFVVCDSLADLTHALDDLRQAAN